MANFQDILKRAIQIRDAVSEGANTASLVGGVMVDTLYNQNKLKQDIDGIIESLKDLSKSDSSGGIDEITLANYLIRNGYAKKSDIPTSWWGQAKNENNEVGGSLHNVLSLLFSDSEIEITGVANANTPTSSNEKIVTPFYAASQFLSKLSDDVASGAITFEKVQKFLSGFVSAGRAILQNGFAIGKNGYGFDENGNIIADSLKSTGFDKAANEGFGMEMETAGTSHLYLANLTVWGKMMINILEIMKTKYAGGNIYMSAAGGTIVKAVPVTYINEDVGWEETSESWCDGWKCYILADDGTTATQNWWMVGDQARCQTFNIKPGVYDNVSNKEYWRCVVAVSSESEYIVDNNGESLYGDKKFDWVILSRTNCLVNSDIPASGDAIVLDGHQVKTGEESSISRTNVLMLESSGADTPRIVGYKGITDFTHKDKEVFIISPSNVTISSSVFKFKSASGQDITIINDRGAYDAATDYYYYDRVSYDNAYWTFIYNGDKQPVKGITPTEKAVNGTVYWRKDLSGGIKGDDGVAYQVMITSDTGTVMINGSGKMTLNATLLRNGEDISDTISNSSWSWWRQSADAEDDAVWNTLHEGVGRSCLITRDDVSRQAQFGCRVYISEVKTIDSNI